MRHILKYIMFLFFMLILFGCVAPPVATLEPPSISSTSLIISELPQPTKTNLSLTIAPPLEPTLTTVATKTPKLDSETRLIAFHEDHLVGDYLVGGIYVIRSDGTDLRHLVDTHDWSWPAWSPNGQNLLFFSYDRVKETRHLNVYNLNNAMITPIFESAQTIHAAKWSPDGQHIIFVLYTEINREDLYLIKPDGSEFQQLTFNPTADSGPTWSPDGKQIAFFSARNGNLEIYIMDLDTQTITQVTQHEADDFAPVWSPNGKQIAFVSMRDEYSEIYLINVDGSNLRRLTPPVTNTPHFNTHPTWSPDNRHLVFVSYHDGVQGLYIMDALGQNVRLLYSGREPDFPAWQP